MGEVKCELEWNALFSLSYGLYIVTSRLGEKLNGQLSNTVFQVCDEPVYVATCVNKRALTHEYISKSGVFGVSVLEESAPMKLIGLFGFKSGREVDKLSQVSFKEGATGCPLVTENALAVLEGKVTDQIDVGKHTVFVAELVSAEVLREGRPLTYAFYRERMKGKTSKNAPTYLDPEKRRKEAREPTREGGERYVCDVCGYVYDPDAGDAENDIPPGTAFEDLPDDWVCPVCGAGKDKFSLEG